MIVGIHQPQYLPWIGYFDKVNKSDVFVILDDVQFEKNEWQNRNKIRNKLEWQWLTVPTKYKFPELINEVKIDNSTGWKDKHYKGLEMNYSRAKYFEEYKYIFEDIYNKDWEYLSDINICLIEAINKILDIKTKLIKSSDIKVDGHSTDKLINICKTVGADTYLSGVGGKDYLEIEKFEENGIKIIFQEFEHPIYQQCFNNFHSHMSIVDLLFTQGYGKSKNYFSDRSTS